MDRDLFFETYYKTATKQDRSYAEKILNTIEQTYNQNGFAEALASKEFVSALFSYRYDGRSSEIKRTSSMSKSHYFKTKAVLQNIAASENIRIQVPSFGEILQCCTLNTLFQNVYSAIDFIDRVGAKLLTGYNKNTELLFYKTVVVLSWHGLSADEMVLVKKEDIRLDGLQTPNEVLPMSATEVCILQNMATATQGRSLPRGKAIYYVNSDKLVPVQKEGCSATSQTINNSISRFNKIALGTGEEKQLSLSGLKQSGIFERVSKISQNNVVTAIQQVTHCPYPMAYSMAKNYKFWLNLLK